MYPIHIDHWLIINKEASRTLLSSVIVSPIDTCSTQPIYQAEASQFNAAVSDKANQSHGISMEARIMEAINAQGETMSKQVGELAEKQMHLEKEHMVLRTVIDNHKSAPAGTYALLACLPVRRIPTCSLQNLLEY